MNDFLLNKRVELAGRTTASQEKVNILLYGNYGTGKSTILSTCRLPIYICSFDPGGTRLKALERLRDDGYAILDTSFEGDIAKSPHALKTLESTLNEMDKAKAFDSLGTLAIDSLTTFSDAVMNEILSMRNRPGGHPQIQDYGDLWTIIRNIVVKCLALPCDFVMTAHVTTAQDEVDGKIYTNLMTLGQSAQKLPTYFDELLLAEVQKGKHVIRCKSDGKFKTSTRRFGGEEFETFEEPDIMALRQKAGLTQSHKPRIGEQK